MRKKMMTRTRATCSVEEATARPTRSGKRPRRLDDLDDDDVVAFDDDEDLLEGATLLRHC